jgi:hypothetical protein
MLNIIDSIHKKYFPEFILSINLISRNCSNINEDNINNQNKFNIHLQNICCYNFKNFNFIYNTEQLSIKRWIDLISKLSYNYTIFDYSLYNIELLKNINPSCYAIFFPILFDKQNMLFENNNLNKIYDISFIGSLTQRRSFIIDQLKNKGYTINIINDCYDFKDKYNKILSSKILLNIHAHNDYKIFEFARCSIPIFNSQIVISENSLDNESVLDKNINKDKININDYILDKVIFSDYDKIIDKVEDVLNNIDRYEYKIDIKELEYYNDKEINRLNNFFKSFK